MGRAFHSRRSPANSLRRPVGHEGAFWRFSFITDGGTAGSRIAILSTFGIKCGIAEYTSYLAQALRAEGAQVWVLGNLLDQHEVAAPALHVRLDGVQVERVWHYDHVTHSRSEVDQEPILRVLKSSGVTHLSVQYHRAFLSERMLLDPWLVRSKPVLASALPCIIRRVRRRSCSRSWRGWK